MDMLVHPPMLDEIILRHLYGFPVLEVGQVLMEQLGVERIGMVKVVGGDILIADEFRGMVVVILGDEYKIADAF